MPAHSLEEAVKRAEIKNKMQFFMMTVRGFQADSALNHTEAIIHKALKSEIRDFIGHQAQYFSKDLSEEVQAAIIVFVDHIFKEVEVKDGGSAAAIPIKK